MNATNVAQNSWLQAQQAAIQESAAFVSRMMRMPQLWQCVQQVKKGATPSEVVYQDERIRLLHYTSKEPPKYRTPLLLVFAMVNRPYILDILPHKSVIGHFVRTGFDTYLIDWGTPTLADRQLTLDNHINGYMRDVVRYLQRSTRSKQLSVLGYCMGGTMSAMFTALHPEWVRHLILMAAGIDFSTRSGLLNLWADPRYFDVDAFIDAFGNCPAEFLQASFLLLSPVRNLLAKPTGLLERLDNSQFVDEYLTMETWLNDNIPVPGEVFREFVRDLYQRNLLVKNQMRVGRNVVNLKQITCAVLNLMATQDNLVPPAQSEPFCSLVGSTDCTSLSLATGHIGLAASSAAHRQLWPQVVQWLVQRS